MKINDEKFFVAIRDFLTVYVPKQRNLSANTQKSYRTALNLFLQFVSEKENISLQQVGFKHLNKKNVSEYLNWLQTERKCSGTTRNQRLMAIRSFVAYCADFDIANILIQIEIEKVPFQKVASKPVEFLSEDAMQTLLSMPIMNNYYGQRNATFMCLMYDTAARCQEMLDLKLKDFIIDTKYPYVYLTGKGEKVRTVPLMQKTVDHLQRYLNWFHPAETRESEDYLFYTVIHSQRHKISPDTVARFVKHYGDEARKINSNVPLRVHPHQFRHTRAIHWYRSGIPLSLVSEYLGHANIQTTLIYAYADTEMKRQAMEKISDSVGVQPIWIDNEEMIKKLYGLK